LGISHNTVFKRLKAAQLPPAATVAATAATAASVATTAAPVAAAAASVAAATAAIFPSALFAASVFLTARAPAAFDYLTIKALVLAASLVLTTPVFTTTHNSLLLI